MDHADAFGRIVNVSKAITPGSVPWTTDLGDSWMTFTVTWQYSCELVLRARNDFFRGSGCFCRQNTCRESTLAASGRGLEHGCRTEAFLARRFQHSVDADRSAVYAMSPSKTSFVQAPPDEPGQPRHFLSRADRSTDRTAVGD